MRVKEGGRDIAGVRSEKLFDDEADERKGGSVNSRKFGGTLYEVTLKTTEAKGIRGVRDEVGS